MTRLTTSPAFPHRTKHEYIGAVTLLLFSNDGSLLYVGIGSDLFLYDTKSGASLSKTQVFPRGIMHGLDYVEQTSSLKQVGVFFGQKRIACFHNLAQSPAQVTCTNYQLDRIASKVFSDWIFDVQVLAKETSSPLLLAVGLAHNFIKIYDATANTIVRSVQCSERCILYALSFYGRSLPDLMVASGTVFQHILLWNPLADQDQADAVAPSQCLHSHDGVIFKLTWSNDASMLASVSDDRTVQLWSNRSRDQFPRADGSVLESVAQTSALIHQLGLHQRQLQKPMADRESLLSTPYQSIMRAWGHTARLWDVAFCSVGLATTSEDGLCKLWDFNGHCLATLQGHVGRHVWRVAVHPTSRLVATGGGDATVKLWDLDQQLQSTARPLVDAHCQTIVLPAVAQGQDPVVPVKKKTKKDAVCIREIVLRNASHALVALESGQIMQIDTTKPETCTVLTTIAMDASRQPNVNLSCLAVDPQGTLLAVADSNGRISIVECSSGVLKSTWDAHQTRILKLWWIASDQLMSSSVDGKVREWRMLPSNDPQLVTTYQSPCKSAVASLAVSDVDEYRAIVCGDGRGNLFVFERQRSLDPAHSEMTDDEDQEPLTPVGLQKSAHAREQIASIWLDNDGLVLTGGHDGYLCSFAMERTVTGQFIALSFLTKESIKGIATIKRVWRDCVSNQLFVLGFYATDAILYNLSAQYRVFFMDCGGWRRPFALGTNHLTSVPAHTFVFSPVMKKSSDQLLVQVHQTAHPTVIPSCSLHQAAYHGRMTTSVLALKNREMLVTASEDNSIKLHARVMERWQCISTGTAHTTAVRALTSFDTSSNQTMIVSGGGKQTIHVWSIESIGTSRTLLGHVTGYENADATQDHRINGLAVVPIPSIDRFVVILACNSEGTIQWLLLELEQMRLVELGSCSSSKKPILSCAASTSKSILAVGSTDGLINLWNLAPVLDVIAEKLSAADNLEGIPSLVRALTPDVSYLAHDMGVNCLCLVDQDHQLSIVSGGDDQSIHVRAWTSSPSMELLRHVQIPNASGSAIKAIRSDGRVIVSAGYDQRVSLWQWQESDVTWQGAIVSECADIADLSMWPKEQAYEVVVVGQGLQVLQFQC